MQQRHEPGDVTTTLALLGFVVWLLLLLIRKSWQASVYTA
jgi:hypothetical protein